MTIGQNIRICRKQRGLTQAQLGALSGVSGTSIGSYERGATLPKRRVVEKIATALGVATDKLIEVSSDSTVQAAPSHKAPLYDGVLAALRELYGAVEGQIILGENGASKRYYIVRGVPDSFILYDKDIAAIAKSAQASMSPLVERL